MILLGIQTCIQVHRPRFLPPNISTEVGQLNQKLTYYGRGHLLKTISGAVGFSCFVVSSPWTDVIGDYSFGQRTLFPTSLSVQAHKPWFNTRPQFLFRQGCNAFLSRHKPALSYCFFPQRDRGFFFSCSDSVFFKCPSAILLSEKEPQTSATWRNVILNYYSPAR